VRVTCVPTKAKVGVIVFIDGLLIGFAFEAGKSAVILVPSVNSTKRLPPVHAGPLGPTGAYKVYVWFWIFDIGIISPLNDKV
jgi:hypothetical protein